jgi:P-type conjugative transfer protein TrbG
MTLTRAISFSLLLFLAGCTTISKPPPPAIPLDEPVQAQPILEPMKPTAVVAVPEPLPLPGQLKPATPEIVAASPVDRTDPRERVAKANDEARISPMRDGYVNAIQVWPYSEGALYQIYASPGRVTDIMLQEGEELISVSAGDTVRWIVGDTTSASGASQRVHVLVKPIRSPLKTNLVITTSRRIYLLELTATPQTWIASVSWNYPQDQLAMLKRQAARAEAAAPISQDIALERLRFRYDISGDKPSWRPLRAFDDGERVYIEFPTGIAHGDLPPLFVVGTGGAGELVNYRYRAPYYIVDRLFGAAELRLGGDKAQVVRIGRNDIGAKGGS